MLLFAEQIRAARAALKMSQLELVELSGVSLSTIQRIESNNSSLRRSSVNNLESIKKVFESRGIVFSKLDENDKLSILFPIVPDHELD